MQYFADKPTNIIKQNNNSVLVSKIKNGSIKCKISDAWCNQVKFTYEGGIYLIFFLY